MTLKVWFYFEKIYVMKSFIGESYLILQRLPSTGIYLLLML